MSKQREQTFIEALRDFQDQMENVDNDPKSEYKRSWVKRVVNKLMDDPELLNEFNLQMRTLKIEKLKGDG